MSFLTQRAEVFSRGAKLVLKPVLGSNDSVAAGLAFPNIRKRENNCMVMVNG